MRKTGFLLLLIIIVIVTFTFVGNVGQENQKALGEVERNIGAEITLEEEVEKEFSPDMVRIVFGVETVDREVEKAFEENNEKMERVSQALNQIQDLEINTLKFRINSRIRGREKEEYREYVVLNQIEVKTNNLEQIGQIIQKAVNSGANQVMSLNYLLEDEEEAKNEVTEIALNKIEEKIQNIAVQLNKNEINLKSLNVNDRYRIGAGDDFRYMAAEQRMDVASTMPPISPEDIKVRVNLRAVYIVN